LDIRTRPQTGAIVLAGLVPGHSHAAPNRRPSSWPGLVPAIHDLRRLAAYRLQRSPHDGSIGEIMQGGSCPRNAQSRRCGAEQKRREVHLPQRVLGLRKQARYPRRSKTPHGDSPVANFPDSFQGFTPRMNRSGIAYHVPGTPLRVTASRRRGVLPTVSLWRPLRPRGRDRSPKRYGGQQPSARGAVKDRALLRATCEAGCLDSEHDDGSATVG